MPAPTLGHTRSGGNASAAGPVLRSRKTTRGRRRAPGVDADRPASRLLRIGWYRRASTDEDNQPYSLEAQKSRLGSYTAAHPEWTLAGDYVERASAKDIEGRPELQRLLADVAAGKLDMVLVARLDRWSRRLLDCMDTVAFLIEHDVAFHSASEHFDTSTPSGMMFLQMLGMFAEFERSTIIDRIHRGNDAKVALGLPLTRRHVPYGMTIDDQGRMAADPDTIGNLRRIFDDYGNLNKGSRDIAAALNKERVRPPSTSPWSGTSVVRLLRHRGYIGEVKHLEEWHPGAHDPVVDVELFEAVQNLLTKRSAPAAARSAASDFILTGTITCGACGGAYVGTTGTSKAKKTHRYYSCVAARRFGAAHCSGPNLPANEFEDLVIAAMLDLYTDHDVFAQAVQAHLDYEASQTEPLTEQLRAQRATLAEKTAVRDRYERDYEAGTLSADRYEKRAGELENDITELGSTIADLELRLSADQPRVPDPAELTRLHELLGARLRTGAAAARKGVCNALIESLVVHAHDDIAPTFRLLAPTEHSDTGSAEETLEHFAGTGGPTSGLEVEGQVFAHHASEWS